MMTAIALPVDFPIDAIPIISQAIINEIYDVIYIANECGESQRHMLYEHFSHNQHALRYIDSIYESL